MAQKMIKCRNCHKMVGANAKRCKYCGTLLRMPIAGTITIIVIVVFVISLIVIGIVQTG